MKQNITKREFNSLHLLDILITNGTKASVLNIVLNLRLFAAYFLVAGL